MISLAQSKWGRPAVFLAGNLAGAIGLWLLLVAPALTLIGTRTARIRSDQTILSRLQAIAASTPAVVKLAAHLKKAASDGEFLSGSNEGVVNAALQALLKSLADKSKAQVRSVQSLSRKTIGSQVFSGARIELSGTSTEVLSTVYRIENSSPLLFVVAAIVKPTNGGRRAPGEKPRLDAQFDVYGATRGKAANE